MARRLPPSPVAGWLIIAAAAGALAGGGAATTWGGTAVAKGKLTPVVKATPIVVVAILGAAPRAAAVFPEHPHEEWREAIVLEVESAPPAPASGAGERLPNVGQGHVACESDLEPDP